MTAPSHPKVTAIDLKELWSNINAEFGLLDLAEFSRRMSAPSVDHVRELQASDDLLVVKTSEDILFPGFQLDENGQVRPIIKALIEVFKQSTVPTSSLSLWACLRNMYLQGDRPVDRLDDFDAVLEAARKELPIKGNFQASDGFEANI